MKMNGGRTDNGFSVGNSSSGNSRPRQVQQQQQHQQHFSLAGSSSALPVKGTSSSASSASRRHSSSSNLYQCESNHSGEEASTEHTSLHHHLHHSTPLSKFGKLPGPAVLQTSSSLVSLLQPPPPLPPPTNNSHFWHCAHHASSSSLLSPISVSSSEGKSKRSLSSNNLHLSAAKPSQRTSSAVSLSSQTSALGALSVGKGGGKSLPSRKQSSSSKSLSSSSNSTYTSSSFSSSSSSSSSKSSSTESDDQQVPSLQHQQQQQQQTRSILRHSCVTDNSKYQNNKSSYLRVLQLTAKEAEGKKELDFWKANIIEHQRKRQAALHNYDLVHNSSSHSDSESSDITNSSGDHCSTDHCHQHHSLTVHNGNSNNNSSSKTWQQTKFRRNKVCFVDEIVQHPSSGCDGSDNDNNSSSAGDIDYRRSTATTAAAAMDVATAGKAAVVSRQMNCSDEEHPFHEESSSSPEVPVALSSSTSSSSIASFSSGELGKVICSGVSRFRGVKEVLGSNGSLSKSYFLPPTAQREDSGIFASDDASTSEFSQSPSPELLIGGGSNVKAMQENGDMENETPSMKERIAFFDPGSQQQQQQMVVTSDLSRSFSCNKSSALNGSPVNSTAGGVGGNLINGGILSRSSSAPYETHCELGTKLSQSSSGAEDLLLTPPQSPPNERDSSSITGTGKVVPPTSRSKRPLPPPPPPPVYNSSSLEQQIGSMRLQVETTAYPVTVEYSKKPAVPPFQSLRDSAITARRFANTCKLKGLVIPQSIIPVHEESSGGEEAKPATVSDRLQLLSMNVTEAIDLPTIISKETLELKVKSSKAVEEVEEFAASRNGVVNQLPPRSGKGEANAPIEFVSLKQQAGDSSVPKYSPMFKRRPLSLPLQPEINYGLPKITPATAATTAAIKTVEPPNILPPPPPALPPSVGHKLPPPAVPPKPKVSPFKLEDISPISKVGIEVPPELEPVVSPKMEDTKEEEVVEESVAPITTVNDESPHVTESSPPPQIRPQTPPTVEEVIEEVKPSSEVDCNDQEPTVLPSPSPSPSPLSQTPTTEAPATNEFVIHQRQYSMRAIVFDLTELPALPLGISLTGGLDAPNKEVTIEQIEPNSVASQDGRLQTGDRIVSINGKLLLGLTHEETEQLLKSAAHSQQVMIVFSRAHDANGGEVCTPSPSSVTSPSILGSMSFPSSTQFPGSGSTRASSSDLSSSSSSSGSSNYKILKAEITKDVNGLGFIIEGGKNPSIGDRPIIIKRIFTGGPVDKEGTLVERDELLSINDQSVQGMSRSEAWHFLKQLPDGQVTLVARRKRYF